MPISKHPKRKEARKMWPNGHKPKYKIMFEDNPTWKARSDARKAKVARQRGIEIK